MKTKALVLTFALSACALVAQTQGTAPTPSQELAPIVAVEEQERDLAKAERLYKEAIDGGKLSAAAKEMATLRLAELLMKLGKLDEAKQWMAKVPAANAGFDDFTAAAPQDRERQEALRAKARELVPKAMQQSGPIDVGAGIQDEELLRQIEWLGDAAVPEIAAVLTATKESLADKAAKDLPSAPSGGEGDDYPKLEAVRGLAGVLWSSGSPAARAQLEAAYRDGSEAFRMLLVSQAARHAPSIRDLVVLWLNKDPSNEVFWALARSGAFMGGAPRWTKGRTVWYELAPETVLEAASPRSPVVRGRVLANLGVYRDNWVALSAAAAARACSMVRELVAGTDPEAARLALRGLARLSLRMTPDGYECLAEHLPQLGSDIPLDQIAMPEEWRLASNPGKPIPSEVAKRLWPKLVSAAAAKVPQRPWLLVALQQCVASLGGEIVDDVIALHGTGFSELLPYLQGRLDPGQALRLAHAFAKVEGSEWMPWLEALESAELPPEALSLLVGKTEIAARIDRVYKLARLVVSTGNPDAASWLLQQAEKSASLANECGWLLLKLGRRTQAEPLRAAMRKWAGERKVQTYEILLALLSMQDTTTLASVGSGGAPSGAAKHPYAKAKASGEVSPLGYLLMEQPDPPHGFTDVQLREFVRGAPVFEKSDYVEGIDPARVPTPLLMMLAESSRLSVGRVVTSRSQGSENWRASSFQEAIAHRIAEEADLDGPLHRWLLGVIGTKGPAQKVVEYLGESERAAIRPQLERLLTGDDAEMAVFAFEALRNEQPSLDCEALTNSKHKAIVERAAELGMNRRSLSVATALRLLPTNSNPGEIAYYFGEKVAVETVPALLQLLQHENSGVRSAAKDALTKIRFVHEQRSYWDRITKGLDASPTSAVEKLLLQAKPGAPTAQRLMAIPSLGALGVPEALPFLIEWTQDADPAVAKAAKDAITQIHLNPRR